MIQKQSDDPNVSLAAEQAKDVVAVVLEALPPATRYDYGGHDLTINEYGVCIRCTTPIAEAQQARIALLRAAAASEDPVIAEHILLAAELFGIEAQAAIVRAEFHNGHNTEPILNMLLGYQYDRSINDTYDHNHGKGE